MEWFLCIQLYAQWWKDLNEWDRLFGLKDSTE